MVDGEKCQEPKSALAAGPSTFGIADAVNYKSSPGKVEFLQSQKHMVRARGLQENIDWAERKAGDAE